VRRALVVTLIASVNITSIMATATITIIIIITISINSIDVVVDSVVIGPATRATTVHALRAPVRRHEALHVRGQASTTLALGVRDHLCA
jgi:hypothetical protein